ncbi:YecA family protein [Pseudomonas siliginis]|uniref:YecA family protein n=1 Tax=Pseudomonas siliginis TaxID=2842346 RepID=UPI002092D860|nr:SEC-C metal-binding domain-containing protein [Pseudomonas siliginis]UST96763.1 SEC-C domain-containing protein [Pseudomonas siliginis]
MSSSENAFSETHASEALNDLKTLALRLRQLITTQPPKDLLGYIYAGLLFGGITRSDEDAPTKTAKSLEKLNVDEAQFLLEYVHAVLATTPLQVDTALDEAVCTEIILVAAELRMASMIATMLIASETSETEYGPGTKDLMFHALTTWVLIRGGRYQVLEEEFFSFALEPHNDALLHTYGVGANEVAIGIQALANSIRMGHDKAARAIESSMNNAQQFVQSRGQSMEEGMKQWRAERAEEADSASAAFVDLFQGGICNARHHTKLPDILLDDLSYELAEETEFYAPGDYSGTPFRTLPARKKPLIKLDGAHYLTDPSFARDAAYRAILYNLLVRDPEYSEKFKQNQKEWSESSFVKIFGRQLKGAKILNEVYYRRSGKWFENDTLVMLDGVLAVIEAKSGAAATIASPAESFERHARAVRDLVVKAYDQCQRFIEYLASADEVPIYEFKDGRYEEVAIIRLSDYWLVLPIGLTVESYSPFSTGSKQLTGISPILGKHPFISVAIDELLVLNRFLPGTGALMHYLSIRQEAAGIKEVFLFDEFDHLGSYIENNRFCETVRRQLKEGATLITMDGMSSIVDDYFSTHDWEQRQPPRQDIPNELQRLLAALNVTRASGWIEADNRLRDFSFEGRKDLAQQLEPLRRSLRQHTHRYFALRVDVGMLFWMHRSGDTPDISAAQFKAQVVAESLDIEKVMLIVFGVSDQGQYSHATTYWIQREQMTSDAIKADAAALSCRTIELTTSSSAFSQRPARNPGRNEPCWCGSGTKFKKCHGR